MLIWLWYRNEELQNPNSEQDEAIDIDTVFDIAEMPENFIK